MMRSLLSGQQKVCLWLAALVGLLGNFSNAYALEDPTRPPMEVMAMMPDTVQPQASALVLSGVKDNGKASFAIVNNQMLRLGESIQGYRLLAVKDEHAILADQGGNKMTLHLEVVDYRSKPSSSVVKRKVSKRKHSAVQK